MASRAAPDAAAVERAFAEAMYNAGYNPGPIQSDTENFIRFDAPGDKSGKGNGYYKLVTGDFPVGWFGDWKQDSGQHTWFYELPGKKPSQADLNRRKREIARIRDEQREARRLRHKEVAEDANRYWSRATASAEGHPYLAKKRVNDARGLRAYTARDGSNLLVVPMRYYDDHGSLQLASLQFIDGDGSKTFMKAGRVDGCFFSIKGDSSTIIICEGYSTANTIWQATGVSVAAAFNAGNLLAVGKAIKQHHPEARLMIAADNDEVAPPDWVTRGGGKPWTNQGVLKASAAAKTLGCGWLHPVFDKGPRHGATDFNDLHLEEGLAAVTAQLGAALTNEKAPADEPDKVVSFRDESWRSAIPKTSHGHPDGANVEGVALYIGSHHLLRDRLRFNDLSKEIEVDDNPLQDHHVAAFRRILHKDNLKARKNDVQDEVEAEARRNTYDPLTSYLNGLKWDGNPRLDTFMREYLGAEDTLYSEQIGRKSLIAAVARALRPGCKCDTMVVLEGDQGTGKSTAIRYLFGDRFFTDHLPDFHSKDSFQQLQGAWCIEVAELAAMSKAEVTDVKQFLSRLVDKFRPPYAHNPIQIPRRTVFWASVNPEGWNGYLKDPTGARRFWPIKTAAIDLLGILRDRDQIWAEAVALYMQGEAWHFTDAEMVTLLKEQQEQRREADVWEEPMREWLLGRVRCTVAQVLKECIEMPSEKQNPQAARRVGNCLRALGWRSTRGRPGSGMKTAVIFVSPDELVEMTA